MDLTPNILIFAPVFYPLIQQAGIDPYYFGLLFVLNLGIGVITPPVGTVLYVVCGIGNIKFADLVIKLIPFILVETIMIVRRIGRQCVEETEGFFALTPEDDPAYVDRWVEACGRAGIDAPEIDVKEALRLEPNMLPATCGRRATACRALSCCVASTA